MEHRVVRREKCKIVAETKWIELVRVTILRHETLKHCAIQQHTECARTKPAGTRETLFIIRSDHKIDLFKFCWLKNIYRPTVIIYTNKPARARSRS